MLYDVTSHQHLHPRTALNARLTYEPFCCGQAGKIVAFDCTAEQMNVLVKTHTSFAYNNNNNNNNNNNRKRRISFIFLLA